MHAPPASSFCPKVVRTDKLDGGGNRVGFATFLK
jgi:hypothetical protein